MSSKNETLKAPRRKPEHGLDLSNQYRKIGIRAVAAAMRNEAGGPSGATGNQERMTRAKEKVNG